MHEEVDHSHAMTMNQRSFASAEFALKKKRTRREVFLAEMDHVVPWARLEALIEPLYPKSGRVGREPIGVPRMYCLQQWYGLADEALEDALYDSCHRPPYRSQFVIGMSEPVADWRIGASA